MSKSVTVSYSVTYDLSVGDIAEEYLEQLGDHDDTASQRAWFAIDRFIGHDNLTLFDTEAQLTIEER